MKFKVGDKVGFLDEAGEGVVSSILGRNTVSVTISEGLEIPYPVDRLILRQEHDPYEDGKAGEIKFKATDIRKRIREKETAHQIKRSKPNNPQELEIDLHIEELLESHSGMTNGEIIQVQLQQVLNSMDKAIARKIPKVVFIHGVGNGRLKYELRKILETYENVTFYDASYKRYGYGATEVKVF